MSRCVGSQEVGKAFAMVASLETMTPIIITQVYTRYIIITFR